MRIGLGAAIVAAAMVAVPTQAATFVVTVSGVIKEPQGSSPWIGLDRRNLDREGIFGVSGRNLAGLSYSAKFTFEAPSGNTTAYKYHQANGTTATINPKLGDAPITATLTIDGSTYDFSGASSGYVRSAFGEPYTGDFERQYFYIETAGVNDFFTVGSMYVFAEGMDFLSTTPMYWDEFDTIPISGSSAFQFYIRDYPSSDIYAYLARGTGTVTHIKSEYVVGSGPLPDPLVHSGISGVVPEPSTWAMMIAGFGLVGGAMRRARQKVQYA